MLNNLFAMAMQGQLQRKLQSDPNLQQMFNKFLGGKSGNEQFTTLLNVAKEKGNIDINAKMFTADDLRQCGIKLPDAQG